MLPGLNPKKVQAMMKQMGIDQVEIPSERVIIESTDKNIIIENPSVLKINMQGQTQFQISGDVSEEAPEAGISKEDIATVVEKTGKSEAEALEALEKASGDMAEAIISLS